MLEIAGWMALGAVLLVVLVALWIRVGSVLYSWREKRKRLEVQMEWNERMILDLVKRVRKLEG